MPTLPRRSRHCHATSHVFRHAHMPATMSPISVHTYRRHHATRRLPEGRRTAARHSAFATRQRWLRQRASCPATTRRLLPCPLSPYMPLAATAISAPLPAIRPVELHTLFKAGSSLPVPCCLAAITHARCPLPAVIDLSAITSPLPFL